MMVIFLGWPAPGGAQEIAWRTYGREQGLDNLAVVALVQDSRGALWAGTEGGLYRDRGAGLERFDADAGILDPQINAIHEDATGRLWVAGASRLYRRAGGAEGDGFVAVTHAGADIPSIEGQRIAGTADGDVLVASRGRLLRARRGTDDDSWTVTEMFDERTIRERPALGAVHAVFSSPALGTWFGCGTGICQLAGREPQELGPREGLPEDTWEAIFVDRESRMWVRGYRHLRVLEVGANLFVARDIPGQSGVASPMLGLAQDLGGAILTRADRGVARWADGRWTIFDAGDGLPPYGVSALLADREGLLWLGTRGNGILRWVGYGEWESWTDRQGLRSTLVWDVLRASPGRVLVANDDATMVIDQEKGTLAPWPSETAAQKQVNTLARAPDGALWAASYSGEVTRVDPESGARRLVATLPARPRLYIDGPGRVWALTGDGIYRIAGRAGAESASKVADPALPAGRYSDATECPDGSLYVVSSQGLHRLRADRWARVVIDDPAAQRGLATIACSPGRTLWVGGALPGLAEIEVGVAEQSADRARVRAWWSRPAISSERISFVRTDARGWLWVGTDRGVDVFNGSRWRHLSQAEGLVWDDTSEGAFRADADGTVWIGTSRGLSRYLTPEALFEPPELEVRIESATVGASPLALDADNAVPWSRSALTVGYFSTGFRFDRSLRFRYRLRGVDEGWQETAARSLRYPALPTGEFRFDLQAFEPATGATSPMVSFSLRVLEPWWRTVPFFAACALAALGVAFAVYRLRTRALVRERRRLETLVAERTRELVSEKRELAEARDALVVRATRDALTGLWNRATILDRLTEEFARAQRGDLPLALVVADLDHFKSVNDMFGHQAGDQVLREVARRLSGRVRPDDLIGRIGGEELLIILPGLGREAAASRLTLLHRAISEVPVAYESLAIPVTLSCGVALYAADVASPQALVRQADRALYRAKASGRNRIEFAWTRSQGNITSELDPGPAVTPVVVNAR
jgi:diguanylate cyclase (GGDEF)-like protein